MVNVMGKGNIIIAIFAIILISSLGSTIFSASSHAQVKVLDLNAPSEISQGDAVCLQVLLKNNHNEKRSFYIGASILVIGEMEWMKLPGWGYTSEIAPFNTSTYFFEPITV
jgi:energy-converting hydrogenase Eha subunit E